MKLNTIWWVLIAILGGFYGLVLVLMLNPAVSEDYRQYYISRESGLSPNQLGRLQPINGVEVAGFRSEKIGFDSWSNAEAEFRWSLGHSPKLHFILNSQQALDSIGAIGLRFLPMGQQSVEIFVNNHLLSEEAYDGSVAVEITLAMPPALLRVGNNTVSFELPDARMPGNADARVLGVALFEVSFKQH